MVNIVKQFPGVLANDHINLEIKSGEIHALLGENGAGKTTLMNILYGLYGPDGKEGKIFVDGKEVSIKQPMDAMSLGIGMVHQHFMLVPIMTVAENVILGSEPTFNGIRLDQSSMRREVARISREYGLEIDPDAKIEKLPVGLQQRVEIVKILYRGANILILDEPTAVLVPQEVTALFKTLRILQQQGKTIIIITHKLKEPMALADRITVLRRGKFIGTVESSQTSPEELAEMMIGRKLLKIQKNPTEKGEIILRVQDLTVEDDRGQIAVHGVNFDIRGGEILGIAGVVGNGQLELVEAITGLRTILNGSIQLLDSNITDLGTRTIYDLGLSYIPEDRQKTGSVGAFTVAENLIIGLHHRKKWYRKGLLSKFLNWGKVYTESRGMTKQFDIRTPSIFTKVRSLSGGNQQKVIVARELSKNPSVVLAGQPTRGLDVGVIEYVHRRLIEMRDEGKAVLLVSSDLDELLTLSDRIAVMYEGEIISYEDPQNTSEQRLGLLMAGHVDKINSIN
ncbi:MAG: ABC transporter ATP-binding protein [Candidatus Heimdallarchaeota archaeon]|nr:MAG: ABC transporter ATP-binding protein [Candidatus Heimdallarchaeota archaeon]